jgi:hypothetical protein
MSGYQTYQALTFSAKMQASLFVEIVELKKCNKYVL